jgi:hypothetical protein
MIIECLFSDAVVRDIEGSKMVIVVGDEEGVMLTLPIASVDVERDEGGDEILGRRMLVVVEEGDVGVVEEILVEDVLAIEDGDDVCLVLEIGVSELL